MHLNDLSFFMSKADHEEDGCHSLDGFEDGELWFRRQTVTYFDVRR
jgi:hypothetical protein